MIKVQDGYFSNNKFVGDVTAECPAGREKEEMKVLRPAISKLQKVPSNKYKTGDCIKGDCKKGYGVFEFFNGDRYEGDFKNGMKHGHGIYIFKDGATYQGMYKEDLRHVYGTYRWTNGAIYIGEYEFGKRNGWGQFIDEHGNKQEGYYVNNKFIGSSKDKTNEQDTQAVIPEKKAPKSPAAL